jgi:Flp pilus assembly protein TadG
VNRPISNAILTRSRERGIAAVEAAVLLPILLICLTFPVFFARYFWHYTVAQKAAQDAARYLSTVSAQEMRSKTLAKAAAAVATEIVRTEMGELSPGTDIDDPFIECGNAPCGFKAGTVPSTVRVLISFGMKDTFFGVVDTGRYGLDITADVTRHYVGN